MGSKLDKWNEAYQGADISSAKPAQVLVENNHLLSKKGKALDLACGRAANAIFLAKHGFDVDAVDISPVVLSSVEQYVVQHNLSVTCICQDIENNGLLKKQYDVIVVSYFLNRMLFPQIIKALKPNGLLFYETWSQQKVDDSGPKNSDFRLKPSELLKLSSGLRPLFYREEGNNGNISKGSRNIAMLIVQNVEKQGGWN
jgi:SAM-dependent methyltransferase